MSTSTADFSAAVEAIVAAMDTHGVMDRFAANDILLDLLDKASSDEDASRVLKALGALPTSSLVNRSEVVSLLAGLARTN